MLLRFVRSPASTWIFRNWRLSRLAPLSKSHWRWTRPNGLPADSVRRGGPEIGNNFSQLGGLTALEYETVCEETLESLCEHFEELVEKSGRLKGSDVVYQDGVLTVNLGPELGVYVINRQSPNKQIWLSSPRSGPKRYDFMTDTRSWVYRHDSVSLHNLLEKEFSEMLGEKVDLSECAHSGTL